MAHAAKGELCVLVVEGGESLGKGFLGPALRVGFGAVSLEEAWEGSGEIVCERLVFVQCGQLGSFGYNEVVAVSEGFAERC